MVATSAVFGLVASFKQLKEGTRGWFYVNALLLLVVAAGVMAGCNETGYLAMALWLVLVVFPNWIERKLQRAMARANVAKVASLARIAQVVHPFDGYRERFLLCLSHARTEAGNLADAKGALYPLLTRAAWTERARVELLALDSQWERIVAHARSCGVGRRDLRLAPLYLRAFGELGDIESMWSLYAELPSQFASLPAISLLMVSYSGLTELTELLLSKHFAELEPNRAAELRAIALSAGSQPERARQVLNERLRSGSGTPHTQWRLAHLPPEARLERLGPTNAEALGRVSAFLRAEAAAMTPPEPLSPVWATASLMLALLLVYVAELPGGSTDPTNLVRLGALELPSTLTNGDVAWRLLAAGFLHLGGTHLLMNCLGLWVLGQQIERLWGGMAMLAVFLVSSVGSFAFAAAQVEASEAAPRIFLGASSGVLGLVGALAIHLATGFLVHSRKALGRRILIVAAVVGAQFLFDWFTPVVSSLLHVAGLVIGGLVSIPISSRAWRQHVTAQE